MKSKLNKLTETERVLKFIKDYKALSPMNKEILKSIADDNLKKLKPNLKRKDKMNHLDGKDKEEIKAYIMLKMNDLEEKITNIQTEQSKLKSLMDYSGAGIETRTDEMLRIMNELIIQTIKTREVVLESNSAELTKQFNELKDIVNEIK